MAPRIGLVGCGMVSRVYLSNLHEHAGLAVVACADALQPNAVAVASEFDIPDVYTVDELIARHDIDLVLNLTIPAAHGEITRRALRSGKHVYTEKPLSTDLAEARELVALAAQRGVSLGSAPDTFLGAGVATASALVQSGAIGTPIAANALMMNHGPERFHPAPDFLYAPGAGPLLDMGPYFVSALITLLGPVRRVTGMAATSPRSREVMIGKRAGTEILVATSTHVSALLQFEAGAVATLVTSWDVVGTTAPRLEIHGTDGSIVVSPPNLWWGDARLKRDGDDDFSEVPQAGASGYLGMGLVEMVDAIASGREPLAGGRRALHIVEVLIGILSSAASDPGHIAISPYELSGSQNSQERQSR